MHVEMSLPILINLKCVDIAIGLVNREGHWLVDNSSACQCRDDKWFMLLIFLIQDLNKSLTVYYFH